MAGSERAFIVDGVGADCRLDGRRRGEYRPLRLQLGVLPLCAGSCQVVLGGTCVIAGVCLQAEAPPRGLAASPTPRFTVEFACLPSSAPSDRATSDGEEFGIAAALEAAFAHSLDARKLLLTKRSSWGVHVSVVVLYQDGSVLDASCLAAASALRDARLPVTSTTGDDAAGTAEWELAGQLVPLPLAPLPLVVGLTRFGGATCVDACAAEEAASADGALWVAVTAAGAVRASGGAVGSVAAGAATAAVRDAARVGKALHVAWEAHLRGAARATPRPVV